jgi:hypothetical protein
LQEEDNFDAERLDDVYERLAQIDADTAEARASAVLAGILLASGAQPAILLVCYARPTNSIGQVGLAKLSIRLLVSINELRTSQNSDCGVHGCCAVHSAV